MRRYRVIETFSDMTDGGYTYKAGDLYPRIGYAPTEKRIKELGTGANALGRKLIAVYAEKPVKKADPVKAEEPTAEVVSAPKKRSKK